MNPRSWLLSKAAEIETSESKGLMAKFDRDEANRVGRMLYNEAQACYERIKMLRDCHSGWHRDHDARISGFAKLGNVQSSVALGIKFYADNLIDPDWWAEHSDGYSAEDKRRINLAYVDLERIAFIQGGVSAVESTLRVLLRAIDPSACNKGLASFRSIYECLFRSKLATEPQEGIALLALFREVRNTVHNNGVYFNRYGRSCVLDYRGVTYHFDHGCKIVVADWDTLTMLMRDSAEMLTVVINHPVILDIDTITDPYA